MGVKLAYSGQKSDNEQITAFKAFYKGAILVNLDNVASVARIAIHNCSSTGTPSATNMIAELSLPATTGESKVDNPTGVIECPDGIRVVKSTGTLTYHIRYSIQPG